MVYDFLFFWRNVELLYIYKQERDKTQKIIYNTSKGSVINTNARVQHKHVGNLIIKVTDEIRTLGYKEELYNVREQLDYLFAHKSVPQLLYQEVIRMILKEISNTVQTKITGLYTGWIPEIRLTVDLLEYGLCDFNLFPFKYITRKEIIDEIIDDLNNNQ